jgi:hypothetical protein
VAGLVGHVVVWTKSAEFVPVRATRVKESGAEPEFRSVTNLAELEDQIDCEPKDRLEGDIVTAGAPVVPVPSRATVCGLPAALSAMVRLALRAPAAAGVNVTDNAHAVPAASVLGLSGQVVVRPKSAALVPVSDRLEIDSGAEPEFVIVTDCAEVVAPTCCDPKLRLVADNVTAGPDGGAKSAPVPESASVWGLPAALSETVRVALRLPAAEGEKVTDRVHDAPMASWLGFVGQVDDCAKSDAFVPESPMPAIVSAAVPEFVSVTDFAALVDPVV